MDKNPVFSVVVPAHNESENLVILLPRLFSALDGLKESYELILVDNASTDNTMEALEVFRKDHPQFRIVSEPTMGYGRAVLTGLKETRGAYIGTIRSDNQEKAEDLARMLLISKDEGLDLHKAIRATRIDDGLKRIIISKCFNTLFYLMFQTKSKDLNASPKILSRAFYERANLISKDWFIDAEMVIKAEKLGMKLKETVIEYLPRLKGKSSVRLKHLLEFWRNMLSWRARIQHGKLLEK